MVKHYSFGWKTVRKVWDKTQGKCFYCGCKLQNDTNYYDDRGNIVMSKRNWHIDHATPISRGGDHRIENLLPSCADCNKSKFKKTKGEFCCE